MEGWTEEEIKNKNLRAPCGIFCGDGEKRAAACMRYVFIYMPLWEKTSKVTFSSFLMDAKKDAWIIK